MGSIFSKSGEATSGRAKIFAWGPSGSMKTTAGLSMPSPVVIDFAEAGSVAYRESHDFGYLCTSSLDELYAAIKELSGGGHGYKTLVLDPLTLVVETINDRWLNYFKRAKNDELYELQWSDYRPIKRECRKLIRSLQSLDMNVMVLARSKTKYTNTFNKKTGKMALVEDGETSDSIKNISYEFDLCLNFSTLQPGTTEVTVEKFRGPRFAKLPSRFQFNYGEFYSTLSSYIGRKEEMEAEAESTIDKNPIRDIVKKLEKLGLSGYADQYSAYVAKKYELDSAESMDAEEQKEQHKILDSLFDDDGRLVKFKEMLETQVN